MALNIGDRFSVEVDKVVYPGKGLARKDNFVVFIPFTLPGETAEVQVLKIKSNYAEAKLLKIINPSKNRINPVCPLAFSVEHGADYCPGCVYQHMDYTTELKLKEEHMENFLSRQGLSAADQSKKIIPSEKETFYRNKISLHFTRSNSSYKLGYRGEDNRTIIDVPKCYLAENSINEQLDGLRSNRRFIENLIDNDKVTIRDTADGETKYWVDREQKKEKFVIEKNDLGDFLMPFNSFFQVNPQIADRLIDEARLILKELDLDTVIDCYCGVGVFAVAAYKERAKRVIGIDSDKTAIIAARQNSEKMAEGMMEFFAGKVKNGLSKYLSRGNAKDTTIILDPPRSGLNKKVVEELLLKKPKNIIYISCAQDTLVRDLSLLTKSGVYSYENMRMLDMFPRTPYFETINLLKRIK